MSNEYKQVDKLTLYKLSLALKPTALRLYLYMYGQSDTSGKVETSYTFITKDLGIARSTISRAMTEIVDANLLEIKLNSGVNSEYFIKLPEIK